MELSGLCLAQLVCAEAARTLEFYSGTLGLTLVAGEEPGSRQLRFTDEPQQSGDYISIAIEAGAGVGRTGIGALHHVAFLVESTNAQLKWKRWLVDRGLKVSGPYDRGYFRSIYFRDPDRTILEIATRWPGLAEDEDEGELGSADIIPDSDLLPAGRDEEAIKAQTWPEPIRKIGGDMDLRGLHHLTAITGDLDRTTEFYTSVLGLRLVKRTRSYDDVQVPHLYFGSADAAPGSLVSFFGYAPGAISAARAGLGVPRGFGFAVADEAELESWRERLHGMGVDLLPTESAERGQVIRFLDPNGITLSLHSTR